MPGYIKSDLVTQYTKERAELEVDLCKKLYAIYDKPPIVNLIKETISFAFEQVAGEVIIYGREGPAFQEGMGESKKLNVFARHAGGPATSSRELRTKCQTILNKWKDWNAADCSDLARFMGSILEKASTRTPEWSDFNRIHTTFKPDPIYKNDPTGAVSGRSRVQDEAYTGIKETRHTKVGRDAGLTMRMHPELGSGINPFMLMPWSTVRRIDVAFGLPEGADISGTTSDAIIVNRLHKRFCNAIGMKSTSDSKVLQLLPLVTMVSHGHHTLLESALTLTLFRVCKYQIGFYTSLLVNKLDGATPYAVNQQILDVLAAAETDRRNHHILCFYDKSSRTYVGQEYSTPQEIREYREFATTGEEFLRYFRNQVSDLVYASELDRLKSGAYVGANRVRIH